MTMEKFITKRLEKFVSDVQNHIFADRFRGKVNAFNEKTMTVVDTTVKFIIVKYRKTSKYVRGKDRTKRFLMRNISAFEKEHYSIVDMIEFGDLRTNSEDRKKYAVCKSRISAILKANRRLNRMKLTNNENVTFALREHINQHRFAKKYELST